MLLHGFQSVKGSVNWPLAKTLSTAKPCTIPRIFATFRKAHQGFQKRMGRQDEVPGDADQGHRLANLDLGQDHNSVGLRRVVRPRNSLPGFCAINVYLDSGLPQPSKRISWPELYVNQTLLGTSRNHLLTGHPVPMARRLAGLDGCVSLYAHPGSFAPKLGRA